MATANAPTSSATTPDDTASSPERPSKRGPVGVADKVNRDLPLTSPGSCSHLRQLSIYPNHSPPLVLLDSPSPLETQIGQIRRELGGHYNGAIGQVQNIIHRWISIESRVECRCSSFLVCLVSESLPARIKSFRDPTESLNPGLLYTGLSALTVSIFARSRRLPARVLLPPLSFLGAFAYFLPLTASRIGEYAEELEDKYTPQVAQVRRTGVAHTTMTLEKLHESTGQFGATFSRGIRTVAHTIENTTGFKLNDALGLKEEPKEKVSSGGDKRP